jgi:dihydrofolate reductase
MRRLTVFNQVSIDGFFTTPTGDLTWAHRGSPAEDREIAEFVQHNASGDSELLLGRVTYDMMVAFWPTPMAHQLFPIVAKGMNEKRKWVASRGQPAIGWQNAQRLDGDLVTRVRELKAESGPPIAVLGSGTIVAQLSAARLVDEYQVQILPIVLGAGRTQFGELATSIDLQLTSSRIFQSGAAYLVYAVRA